MSLPLKISKVGVAAVTVCTEDTANAMPDAVAVTVYEPVATVGVPT
jgi:hypothetical protein